MRKVLINLLHNGIEAMHEAGVSLPAFTLTLRTTSCKTAAQLTIQDNGPGVSAEDLHRLFEPFFTTKTRGLGMGLVISRALIEENGGQLWIDPQDSTGATFHLTLPFRNMKRQTLFVVDDDLAVRDALTMLLDVAGYDVAAFPDADSFLKACTPDTSGCIILDVNMTGMNGPDPAGRTGTSWHDTAHHLSFRASHHPDHSTHHQGGCGRLPDQAGGLQGAAGLRTAGAGPTHPAADAGTGLTIRRGQTGTAHRTRA